MGASELPLLLRIAGGGIGGLAAAIAATQAGWAVQVHEQAAAYGEAGAGVQLGPNATRVLRRLGVFDAAAGLASTPRRLVARNARDGCELGVLPLADFEQRHGAPYLTMHRADLHGVLLDAARAHGVLLRSGSRVGTLELGDAAALLGADGLWSQVRQLLLGDGAPAASDHVAYRGMARLSDLPSDAFAAALRDDVTAWLAPGLHVVTYPVHRGEWLNVVCVTEGTVAGERSGWDLPAAAAGVRFALARACEPLQAVAARIETWGLWVLHDRAPVAGPQAMARGRVALLGDAAHPMRPYLAQGAAMALEDAQALGECLRGTAASDVQAALARYAQVRWARCARVQRRSLRNAAIFHASGGVRIARDLILRAAGARLMDVPWLYGG